MGADLPELPREHKGPKGRGEYRGDARAERREAPQRMRASARAGCKNWYFLDLTELGCARPTMDTLLTAYKALHLIKA